MSFEENEDMNVMPPSSVSIMYPWRWGDVLTTGLRTLGNVIGVIGAGVHTLGNDVEAAVNWSRRTPDDDELDNEFKGITKGFDS